MGKIIIFIDKQLNINIKKKSIFKTNISEIAFPIE
jgi:hypothetical protein